MIYSKFDENKELLVDCTECVNGYNSERSCPTGYKITDGGIGSCFSGKPFRFIKSRLEKNEGHQKYTLRNHLDEEIQDSNSISNEKIKGVCEKDGYKKIWKQFIFSNGENKNEYIIIYALFRKGEGFDRKDLGCIETSDGDLYWSSNNDYHALLKHLGIKKRDI